MKKIIRITAVLLLSVSLFSFDFNKDLEKKYDLKAEKDKKSGITWFKHNSCVKASSRFYLYFGITKKKVWFYVWSSIILMKIDCL